MRSLYNIKKFIMLRKEYKTIYGEYPVFLVENYKTQIKTEPVHSMSEMRSFAEADIDKEIETRGRNQESISPAIDLLNHELVWGTDLLKNSRRKRHRIYLIPVNMEA